jgi:hypothetical protein
MSKEGHTPGPWEVDRHYWTIQRRLPEGADSGELIEVFGRLTGGENSEANARLIAAAPDMLKALDECLALFDMVTALDDHGSNAVGQAENLIRTAIAKATAK